MIKSMTGYGIANFENDTSIISVEVKTLNSKFLDLSIRSPRQFSDKEMEVRNIIAEKLERGKVNVSIDYNAKSIHELPITIHEDLFISYFEKYRSLAEKVGVESSEIYRLALQSPNVSTTHVEVGRGQEDWELIKSVLVMAIEKCDQFRQDEGNTLYRRFEENIRVLEEGLENVRLEEPRRREKIQSKIKGNFSEWLEENSFDQNRFEQELIYYFEKVDITEEIVRLGTHLDYFKQNLSTGKGQGKKLGFISQEMGREINTIGSKANDAVIQRHVIMMKDELEKIKEQALNIL